MKRKISEVPVNGIIEIVPQQRAIVVGREPHSYGWSDVVMFDGTNKRYVWEYNNLEVDYKGQGYYEVVIRLNGEKK